MVFIAYGYNTTLICTKLYCRFDKILFCIFYYMRCNFVTCFRFFYPKSKLCCTSLIFYSSYFFIFFNPFVYHISFLGISQLLDCFLNTSKFIVHFHYSYLFLFAISHLIFPFLLVQLFVRTSMFVTFIIGFIVDLSPERR